MARDTKRAEENIFVPSRFLVSMLSARSPPPLLQARPHPGSPRSPRNGHGTCSVQPGAIQEEDLEGWRERGPGVEEEGREGSRQTGAGMVADRPEGGF